MSRRLAITFVTFLSLAPWASATLTPPRQAPLRENVTLFDAPTGLARHILPVPKPRPDRPEYVVTNATEIRVDGRFCRYEDVPSDVVIERLELAEDGKTVVTIHFRTRK